MIPLNSKKNLMHEQNFSSCFNKNEVIKKSNQKKFLKTHFKSKHRELMKLSALHQHSGQLSRSPKGCDVVACLPVV